MSTKCIFNEILYESVGLLYRSPFTYSMSSYHQEQSGNPAL